MWRDYLGNVDTDGKIQLKWILREDGYKCVAPIQQAQNEVQCWDFVNTVMNNQVQ